MKGKEERERDRIENQTFRTKRKEIKLNLNNFFFFSFQLCFQWKFQNRFDSFDETAEHIGCKWFCREEFQRESKRRIETSNIKLFESNSLVFFFCNSDWFDFIEQLNNLGTEEIGSQFGFHRNSQLCYRWWLWWNFFENHSVSGSRTKKNLFVNTNLC